jgi:hypothetical protein
MNVLLDHNVVGKLRAHLSPHQVRTTKQEG